MTHGHVSGESVRSGRYELRETKGTGPLASDTARIAGTTATVGIGDQLATDVLGAHLHGMRAFYVDPLCTADLAYMHVLRAVDRVVSRIGA